MASSLSQKPETITAYPIMGVMRPAWGKGQSTRIATDTTEIFPIQRRCEVDPWPGFAYSFRDQHQVIGMDLPTGNLHHPTAAASGCIDQLREDVLSLCRSGDDQAIE
jgi:hypothetical protein